MKQEEAEKVADVIQGLLDAWTELTNELNPKRDTNWHAINKSLYDGEQMLAKLRAGLKEVTV